MPCYPFSTPDGVRGIFCVGRRKPAQRRCSEPGCTTAAEYQCDGAKPARKTGLCDRHLCADHAAVAGSDIHHCPTCAGAGHQGSLFSTPGGNES